MGDPYKIVILGEGRVGKTSLLRRYVSNTFDDQEASTRSAAYLEKRINVRGHQVHLSLWDTAGQERFHALAPMYYRDADGAVLVYDITEKNTFERVARWVKELQTICTKPCALGIIGNKADLRGLAQVSAADAENYARSISGFHALASAKSGQGVEDAFSIMAESVLNLRLRSGPARKSLVAAPSLVGDDRQGGAQASANSSRQQARERKGCCAGGGSERDSPR